MGIVRVGLGFAIALLGFFPGIAQDCRHAVVNPRDQLVRRHGDE
jgi:hypothetical protein